MRFFRQADKTKEQQDSFYNKVFSILFDELKNQSLLPILQRLALREDKSAIDDGTLHQPIGIVDIGADAGGGDGEQNTGADVQRTPDEPADMVNFLIPLLYLSFKEAEHFASDPATTLLNKMTAKISEAGQPFTTKRSDQELYASLAGLVGCVVAAVEKLDLDDLERAAQSGKWLEELKLNPETSIDRDRAMEGLEAEIRRSSERCASRSGSAGYRK